MCRWASSIHENLKFRGSDLEFQLLKSQFVSLLLNGQITEAIQHSKCQFQKFTEKNQKGNNFFPDLASMDKLSCSIIT